MKLHMGSRSQDYSFRFKLRETYLIFVLSIFHINLCSSQNLSTIKKSNAHYIMFWEENLSLLFRFIF